MAEVRNLEEKQRQFIRELDVEMGIQPLSHAYGPIVSEKKKDEKTEEQPKKKVSKVDVTDPVMGTAFLMYHDGAQGE